MSRDRTNYGSLSQLSADLSCVIRRAVFVKHRAETVSPKPTASADRSHASLRFVGSRLEQEGYITSEWGVSENNRRAKYYRLTRAGRRQLEKETREWQRTAAVLERFLTAERS